MTSSSDWSTPAWSGGLQGHYVRAAHRPLDCGLIKQREAAIETPLRHGDLALVRATNLSGLGRYNDLDQDRRDAGKRP
ncbi:hypothetical protein GCM10027452_24590 [Micromonospora halotolerans]